MSVAAHLNVSPAEYDERIRQLIPHYDELVREAAHALRAASRRLDLIVDLGIGTGALTAACLTVARGARVVGIDADPSMMAIAERRLRRRLRDRLTLVQGLFHERPLPACDALVATYALHHFKEFRKKQLFYRRCFEALRPGGVLVSGDCMPAATDALFAQDLEVWYAHLGRTFGRAGGRRVYASWADEDTYVPLAQEVRMLERAGFDVEVPWRRSPFAVVVGIKPRSAARASGRKVR